MAFIYSVNRTKIEIEYSPDDIGVRFEREAPASDALKSARTALKSPESPAARGFGRTLLLSQIGVARNTLAAVRDALPHRLIDTIKRTLPVYTETASGLRLVASREIIVRFRRTTTAAQQDKLLKGFGLAKRRKNEFTRDHFVVGPSNDVTEPGIIEMANALAEADSLVEYATPNFLAEHRKAAPTNDRLLAKQWHLHNTGERGALAGEDVDAFRAWDITPGGARSVVIAVVDDGVDLQHPDLRANVWVNPNPKAPDRHGRNFYDGDYDPNPRYYHSPYDRLEGNDSHGTACAGVAAAVGNNRRGVAGIAYNCTLLPIKIFGADALAPNDQVANALRYAGRHAQVISCSWSGAQNADLESAVDEVASSGRQGKGCLVFCAAGNDARNRIGFPASHPRAFGVGASNDRGVRALYSNYGEGLAFVCPSSDPQRNRQSITTTDVSQRNRGFNLNGAYTDQFGGTSAATPLAAGIAALVLSVNPALTRDEVGNLLGSTAKKIDRASGNYRNGYSEQYGFGRLNAHRAVAEAQARLPKRAKK
jgi:hypothetical protein